MTEGRCDACGTDALVVDFMGAMYCAECAQGNPEEVMPNTAELATSHRIAEGDGTMTPAVDDPNQGEPDPPGSSLGVHQGDPFPLPIDPAEAHALLSSLMRRYAEHEKALKIILASEKAQIAEIVAFEKERADMERAELAELKRQMRPLAAALVPFDPERRKTIRTVAGDAQFHAGSTSIEVAKDCVPTDLPIALLRYPVPKPEVNRALIAELIREGHIVINDDGSLSLKGEDGERVAIPGVRFVRAEESFTVRPR